MHKTILILLLFVMMGCSQQQSQKNISETNSKPRILVVASNMRHPPFSSWDKNGNPVGIEVEIVEKAAKDLGYKTKWVERTFGDLLNQVESGEVDIAVSTIGITKERQKKVAFSQPYFETQIVALVSHAKVAPKLLSELKNPIVGADRTTTSYIAAKKQFSEATLIDRARDNMTWPQMLQQKLIDVFVVDASDKERIEKLSGILLTQVEQPLSAEYFGIAVNLKSKKILQAINRSIEVLNEGSQQKH